MMGICHKLMLSAKTAQRKDVGDAVREPPVSPALLGSWTDSQTVLGQSTSHWPDSDPTLRRALLCSIIALSDLILHANKPFQELKKKEIENRFPIPAVKKKKKSIV